MKSVLIVVALVVGLCTSAFALPYGLEGQAKVTYGEVAVPGSTSDVVKYHTDLLLSRPCDINGLTVSPYIRGEFFNESVVDDLLLTVVSVGADVEITDNIILGVNRSCFEWKGNVDDTRDTCSVTVKF